MFWFLESLRSLVGPLAMPPPLVPRLLEIFLSESRLRSALNFAWKPNPPSPKWVFLICYYTKTFCWLTPRLSTAFTYLLTGLLWLLLVNGLPVCVEPSWILYSFLTLLPLPWVWSISENWLLVTLALSLFHIKFARLLLWRKFPLASIYSTFI